MGQVSWDHQRLNHHERPRKGEAMVTEQWTPWNTVGTGSGGLWQQSCRPAQGTDPWEGKGWTKASAPALSGLGHSREQAAAAHEGVCRVLSLAPTCSLVQRGPWRPSSCAAETHVHLKYGCSFGFLSVVFLYKIKTNVLLTHVEDSPSGVSPEGCTRKSRHCGRGAGGREEVSHPALI